MIVGESDKIRSNYADLLYDQPKKKAHGDKLMGSILYVVYCISHVKGIQREVFSEYVCNWYVNCHIKWHFKHGTNVKSNEMS